MPVFNNILAGAAGSGGAAGYEISRSLRFNSADSAYLSRTPSSASNRKTWTWSGWVKRTALGADKFIFSAGSDPANFHYLRFTSSNTLEATEKIADSVQSSLITSAVFRDPSAWYHIIYVYDSTQATAADRLSLYVNGVEITAFGTSTYPSQNHDSYINSTSNHFINARPNPAAYSDFYLAEIQLLDGIAVSDATDFGEYDSNNVWQPKAYSESYGTNGFHLDFSDNSTAAALGYDAVGSNDWTVNNLSVASGAGNDSLIDTPTNYEADSGNNGGNYATLNPLDKSSSLTVSNGNLEADTTGGWDSVRATFGMSSGKYYWETQNKQTAGALIGIALNTAAHGALGTVADGAWTWAGANVYINGTALGTGLSNHSSSDIVQYALDVDAGKLWFGRNGTWYNSSWGTTGNPATGANPTVSGLSTTSTYFAAVALIGSGVVYNFGARSFSYTPPTGFLSLCTTNLPDPTIADGSTAFDVNVWDGDGTTNRLISTNFSPDFTWMKIISQSGQWHLLADSVRGGDKTLSTNNTNAEVTRSGFVSFDSTGFTIGDGNSNPSGGQTLVGFAWDGGTSTVSNTDGSITSQVRANASAGFSIVSYTGNGSAGATVGTGLNASPDFVIIKVRNGTAGWFVWHSTEPNKYLAFDTNAAVSNTGILPVTNSTIGFKANYSIYNANTFNYVAYCFSPVSQYSSFGSYTGNASASGPFVYTGFRPKWILFKMSSGASDWRLMDTSRDPYNACITQLYPNNTDAEIANSSAHNVDYLSNGFRVTTSHPAMNSSGQTFIYAAFAEHPFKTARAR